MALRSTKTAGEKPAKSASAAKPENAKPLIAKPAAKVKPAAKAKPAAKVKPEAEAGAGKPDKAAVRSDAFKLKDLVAAVAEATGGKKPEVKRVVEATLASLGMALGRGSDLAVPPLGRARIVKSSGKDGAAILTLKLRLGGADQAGAKQALADDGEDS